MSPNAPDWEATYRPLIGAALQSVVFLSHTAATRDVVAAMDSPVVAYSEGVVLRFENDLELVLTWQQYRLQLDSIIPVEFGLEPVPADYWGRFNLDQIQAGYSGDWEHLGNATLERVSLHGFDDLDEALVVGIGHHLKSERRCDVVWVFVASQDLIDCADDLLVSVNHIPPSRYPLVERRVIQ